MVDILDTKRSVYREIFNNLCADYAVFRLHHEVNEKFAEIERRLWIYRAEAISMKLEDIEKFDNEIASAKAFLIQMEVFDFD